MGVNILAIESSCDDTSVAVLSDHRVLSNIISSQIIHKKYGGVVPEAASRIHMEMIVQCCNEALITSGLSLDQIQAIAVTRGPGLMGSLIVGLAYAKGLALSLGIPLIEVNHLQAHVYSVMMDQESLEFPILCLTVSGGHTQLCVLEEDLSLEILGQTIDDAAGEAFDKIGKLLQLPYPAGPLIDKMAKEGKAIYTFPKAKVGGHDFSFSGLKTSVLYFLQKQLLIDPEFITKEIHNLCASVQKVICDMLLEKTIESAEQYGIKSIGIAGGVSANSHIRTVFKNTCDAKGWNLYIPKISYCTDNAAMIGIVSLYKYQKRLFATMDISALARYSIKDS
ncbi:MAG TPA: tRNA (adenosine(37)-N6)-threonylcarbamoyltransferase complex transferase subunit TsaD [Saprospiraceae bacterium]|nr:tRNA (adenosine(37)-N6)-threonylcarbamoyltransferase complex transferase subunit TsaD [Saprospiraceae bacterium]